MSRAPHHFGTEDDFAMATVYLRLTDVPLPSVYRPTADPS
jgi:hypothetical protein